jgi:hypothetical protein
MFNLAESNILQRDFNQKLAIAINFAAQSYNLATKKKWQGSVMEGRIQTTYMNSISAGTDGGAYPTSDSPTLIKTFTGRKFIYASADLTYGLLAASQQGENSWGQPIEFLTRNLARSLAKFKNGFFFGAGTGIVGRLMTTTGTTDIRIRSYGSGRDAVGLSLIWDKNSYDVYSSNGVTKRVGRLSIAGRRAVPSDDPSEISVDLVSGTALPSGVQAGDIIVWKDSLGLVPDGLQSLINDDTSGSLQGVTFSDDLSSHSWTSVVVGNSGNLRPMQPSHWRALSEGIYTKSGELRPKNNKVIGFPSQMSNFADMYEGELRFTPNDDVVGSGAATIQTPLAQFELTPDVDCPPPTVFDADMSQIEYCVQMPLGFVNPVYGSNGMFQSSMTSAVLAGRMIEIAQYRIQERKTSGKITDLTYAYQSQY